MLIELGIIFWLNSFSPGIPDEDALRRMRQPETNALFLQQDILEKIEGIDRILYGNGLGKNPIPESYWNYVKYSVKSPDPVVRIHGYKAFLYLPVSLSEQLIPKVIKQLFSDLMSKEMAVKTAAMDTLALFGKKFEQEEIAKRLLPYFLYFKEKSKLLFESARDALVKMGEGMYLSLLEKLEGLKGVEGTKEKLIFWNSHPELRDIFADLAGRLEIKDSQAPGLVRILKKLENLIRYEGNTDVVKTAIDALVNLDLKDETKTLVNNFFNLNEIFNTLIGYAQPSYGTDLVASSLKALAILYRKAGQSTSEKIKAKLVTFTDAKVDIKIRKAAFYGLGELGIATKDVMEKFKPYPFQQGDAELIKEISVAFYKLTYRTGYLEDMLKDKNHRIRAAGATGYGEIGKWLKEKERPFEVVRNGLLEFSRQEIQPQVRAKIALALSEVSDNQDLEVLNFLKGLLVERRKGNQPYQTGELNLDLNLDSFTALSRLKPQELPVLERIRDLAYFGYSALPDDLVSRACWVLGEMGYVDSSGRVVNVYSADLEILKGQIESSSIFVIRSSAVKAMMKLLSLVLEKSLAPYVKF